MKNKKQIDKKALSPVIATVLLILLSIAAVVIIAGAVIPFVRDKMDEAKECSEIINVVDALVIDTNAYYCYYDESVTGKKIVNITIHRGQIDIKGIKIAIRGEGDSKVVDIEEGAVEGVRMLDGSLDIVLPAKGGEKTYSILTDLDSAESIVIAPIMPSGQVCKETDEIELSIC